MNDEEILKREVTGLVLCGGLGRRLGGVDKGLHPVAGRPMAMLVLDRLAPQVGELTISANRNRDIYGAWGYPVVADESDSFDGPLAGVLSALGACRSPWLVTVPCDAPNLPHDLVERLLDAADAADTPTACAFDGRRLQPTFCAYRRDIADSLRGYLAAGERKIDRFLEDVGLARADFRGRENAFLNLNTPGDVAAYEADSRDSP